MSDDWIDAVAYEEKKEDGGKYYHIVYENGDVSDVDDDDEFADAIEAGYYEFTDEVLTDLDCDTDEEEEEKEDEESKRKRKYLTIRKDSVTIERSLSFLLLLFFYYPIEPSEKEDNPWIQAFHDVFNMPLPVSIRKTIESSSHDSKNLVLTSFLSLSHRTRSYASVPDVSQSL